jgi:hypothetical protein
MTLCDIDDRVKAVIVTGQFSMRTRLKCRTLTNAGHGKMYCAGADLGGDKPAFQRDTKVRVPDQRDG